MAMGDSVLKPNASACSTIKQLGKTWGSLTREGKACEGVGQFRTSVLQKPHCPVQVRGARHISSALEEKSESACLGHTLMPLRLSGVVVPPLALAMTVHILPVNSPDSGS